MIYLVLSISCSVIVGVLLKLAKRYQINIMQAVTWNYLFAIVLSAFFFKPDFSTLNLTIISPIYVLLGILLPAIFLIQGISVQQTGLARTDIAQRLSLFISLCAAYFLFNESFGRLKYVGLIIGFTAIIFTIYRKSGSSSSKHTWWYLLLVFVGFGAIDVLFKLVSQITVIPYITSLFLIFCIAFVFSLLYIFYLAITKKTKIQFINFVCGCILGFFNFGNILFYLKAHRAMSDQPSTVFAAMNIGVIIIGSLIGIVIFKERLSKLNYIGLILALIAILLITISKLHAI
ncbi:EamA family transporter [Pedobacter boryungensis]|uniref:EamA/RhaT family transporter n=2 Tax=Pedobacter boryungensis TaxID=869962 RepID=A0ABX2D9W8_9SPHI|nr:EamA/RhaT family transporter [Pedobacter boryungensis]NQX30822.1 EamA/RhaT family transporter [Pedobacter boryungensis]